MELGATLPEVPRALYLHTICSYAPHVTMSSRALPAHNFIQQRTTFSGYNRAMNLLQSKRKYTEDEKQQLLANLDIEGLCGLERGI